LRGRDKGIIVQWGKSVRPYLKNKQKPKGLGFIVQMVEHLPSKWEVLSSIPSTSKEGGGGGGGDGGGGDRRGGRRRRRRRRRRKNEEEEEEEEEKEKRRIEK
jgi:hypothetical protein